MLQSQSLANNNRQNVVLSSVKLVTALNVTCFCTELNVRVLLDR